MNEAVVKRTQDKLGKIIGKKPPLTEKLLNRPPFRFLHDVLTSVTKQTGFMKGLFTEKESAAETITNKDEKIAYLQKAIDIVAHVTGSKLNARPSKIVAGLEAEHTNEFLQTLAEAVAQKPDNESAVKAVLGGGGDSSSNKESRPEREASSDKRKRREKSDNAEKDKDARKSKPKEKESVSKESSRRDGDRRKDRDSSRHRDSSKNRDASSKGSRGERHRDSSKNRDDREKSPSRDEKRDEKRDGKRDEKRDERRDKREKSASRDERRERKDRDEEKRDRSKKESEEKTTNGEPDAGGKTENEEHEEQETGQSNRIPRPSSAKGSRRRHREGRRTADEDMDGELQTENAESAAPPPPEMSNTRRLRPASARPAPPKVKRQEAVQDGINERIDSGTRRVENLIVDQPATDDDDDDNFTVDENLPAAEPITVEQPENTDPGIIDTGEHGGLVKKILESKKEFSETAQSQSQTKTKIDKSNVNDATRNKEREIVRKEVDKLRNSIQSLTRSANPLGKVMDYVQEDLHSMQKERDTWKTENKKLLAEIQKEQGITEQSIEPLKGLLAQLEQAVSDQLDLIAAAKHKIIDNDDKVSKMLSSIAQA